MTLNNLIRGVKSLLQSDKTERNLDEELEGFLNESIADKERRGYTPQQASRMARVEMGSTNAVKHHVRSTGWETLMENLLQDLRYILRVLRRSPGFTAVAVLSLALGIGANTAIFTLIRQVVLKQLPVQNPQELYSIGTAGPGGILGGVDIGTNDLFPLDFARQMQHNPGPFQGAAAYGSFAPMVNIRIPGSAESIQAPGKLVTGNFFQVLQATPLMGRTLLPSDDTAKDANPVAVISYHFWLQSMSADPNAVGKTLTINSIPFTILGVMPEGFHDLKYGIRPTDFWFPLTMAPSMMVDPNILERDHYFLDMVVRREPTHTLAADQQWLDSQMRNYARAAVGATPAPGRLQEISHITSPLTSASRGLSALRNRYADSLLILSVIVAVVLLIACANLANFLLARAIARQREVATRLALGSSRGRILTQSLMEALVLSLTGGLLGLGFAFLIARALIAFVMHGSPDTVLSASPDLTVLAFTFTVSILAGLLFGFAPALQFARSQAGPTLSPSARGTANNSGRFWPKALITSQVVLALLLLVVAGLFLRTLRNLQDQDLGFDRFHLLIAEFKPDIAGYTPEKAPMLNQRMLEALSAIPGVRSAALADSPPISNGAWRSSMHPAGYTAAPDEQMAAVLKRVSGRYFETTGSEIVAGRGLAVSDTSTATKVVVVNQTLANKYFPHGDAIGRTIGVDITTNSSWNIVGIARDTRAFDLRGTTTEPMIYLPVAQLTDDKGQGTRDSFAPIILVRTVGDPAMTTRAVRGALHSVDPNLPILNIYTMQEHLNSFTSSETLISRLTSTFAMLAVLLSAIGLYGVMSFNVARRTNEIGIRMALGASNGGVQWMVLRESLSLLMIGLAIGLPATLVATRLLRSQLYQMSPFDPIVFIAATLGIAIITLLSAWIPSRRAASIDPMVALRYD